MIKCLTIKTLKIYSKFIIRNSKLTLLNIQERSRDIVQDTEVHIILGANVVHNPKSKIRQQKRNKECKIYFLHGAYSAFSSQPQALSASLHPPHFTAHASPQHSLPAAALSVPQAPHLYPVASLPHVPHVVFSSFMFSML